MSAPTEGMANGENHDSVGRDRAGAGVARRRRARARRAAKTASVTISAASSQRCVRALTSIPITQTTVMIAIHATPIAVTASSDGLWTPNSRKL